MSNYEFYRNKPKPKNHVCAVALIVRDGKVLMGLREYDKEKPLWTFPGGRCDPGEKPEETLKREVAEEIGVTDLIVERLLGEKAGAYTSPEGVNDRVFMYQCATNQEPRRMEPEKFLEWKWVDPGNPPKNLIDSKDIQFMELIR